MEKKIVVRLKANVSDPVGETLTRTLKESGYENILEIRSGKFFEMKLDADGKTSDELETEVRDICEKVLTHPVMEDYTLME